MGSVHVEVRFQAQARHDSNGPGLLGCCHLANDLGKDQPIMRSHPNKVVDVDACQTSKISGLHPINSCLVCSSPVVHGYTVLVCLHPSTRLPLRLPPPAPGVPPA